MRIKLDENLSRHLAAILANEGHDASTAADEGLLGKSDADVGAAAHAEDRLVFSLDLDFADLRRFPPGTHPGIVVFRPRSMGPQAVNDFISAFVGTTDLAAIAGCIVVVDPNRVRVRRPSIHDEGPEPPETAVDV